MAHQRRPFPLASLSAIALWLCLALACHTTGQSQRSIAAGSMGAPPPEGQVVEAQGNIATYIPKTASVSADPAVVDLRQVLEEMGPEAILWYQHVQTLANPFFEGRRPTTRGAELTREYIEFYYRLYGLEPAFPAPETDLGGEVGAGAWVSYRQPFVFNRRDRKVEVKVAALEVEGQALEENEDFAVLGNSGSGEVTAPITFVGYGIDEGPDGYTSFDEETDLTGRVALLLRYAPMDDDGEPLWEGPAYRRQAGIARKMRAVAERGAAAILMVNPPGAAQAPEGLESTQGSRRFGRGLDIPALQVTPQLADRIVREADPLGRDLATWRRLADKGSVAAEPLADEVQLTLRTDVNRVRLDHEIAAENVGGVLRGRGSLAEEWIVIGAHHDHVGDVRGKMHPGADDNASGTAGVLVLAKMLAEGYEDAPARARLRSVLFVTFDAEEMGLHGSRHLTSNLPIEAERASLCLNMDMIGRLRNDELWVLGTETGEGLGDVLRRHFLHSGLTVRVRETGSGRSDDANFHRSGIPALHFFTGMHSDYTTPADQAHRVNPAGAARIVDLVYEIAWDAARRPAKFDYRDASAQARGPGQDRGYAPVRLGIRPGLGDGDDQGVLIDEVYEGTSAGEAGVQAGDVIRAWDGEPIETLGDLFQQLQSHKPGDVVKLTVQRDGQTLVLAVTLKAGQ